MNPHDLSLRSKNRYETFLLLVVRICIDSSLFEMGTTSVGVGGCTTWSNLNNESTCSSLNKYYLLARGWLEELPH